MCIQSAAAFLLQLIEILVSVNIHNCTKVSQGKPMIKSLQVLIKNSVKNVSNSRRLLFMNNFGFSSQEVKFTFINRDNSKTEVTAKVGQHILEIAKKNEVELEGACEASLACSTCHVILPSEIYQNLQDPCDEQQDLLDLAFGLTPTSRLGCQVKVTKDFQGCQVVLPKSSRNMYVDGSKPLSH